MLSSLVIKNIVLIESLTIEFQSGLCALTGETGAGKSILLDSLGLVLGARADAGLVRKGTDQSSVTGEFDIPKNHPSFAFLRDQDFNIEGPIILRRVLNADGRSKAYINDHPVSVSLLKQVGAMLTEVHGQFDTHSLLDPKYHCGLLDDYGVNPNILKEVKEAWQNFQKAQKELANAEEGIRQAKEDELYFREALVDLNNLNPEAGEEEKLSQLRERLLKREHYLESLNTALQSIEQAQSLTGKSWRALEKTGAEGKAILDTLDRCSAELEEAFSAVLEFSSSLEDSQYSLEEIDDRLFALKAQARKHGCKIDELPNRREEIDKYLSLIDKEDGHIDDLKKNVLETRNTYIVQAQTLSSVRKTAAEKLDKLVARELGPLKMDKAKFKTDIALLPEEEWGARGMEKVQFLVSTNPNTDPGPLNKIASGGEMSRFMLALKVVLAQVGVAQSFVFDEVDSGVGGATADAVGERLARLAEHKQILVVTHSPQVAARASHHWIVSKSGQKSFKTTVTPLPEMQQRQEEIARMLSGAEITKEARAAANKLLEGKAA